MITNYRQDEYERIYAPVSRIALLAPVRAYSHGFAPAGYPVQTSRRGGVWWLEEDPESPLWRDTPAGAWCRIALSNTGPDELPAFEVGYQRYSTEGTAGPWQPWELRRIAFSQSVTVVGARLEVDLEAVLERLRDLHVLHNAVREAQK